MARARCGVVLAVLVALAAMALPLRITPRGIGPEPGSVPATDRTERVAVHGAASTGMPEQHRDGSHPHEAHCFWCLALVGPITAPTFIERGRTRSLGVVARSRESVPPRGLDLSFAPRAPPLLAVLPL